jgi:LAO/AO transport system kinase
LSLPDIAPSPASAGLDRLIERLVAGDAAALARCITLAEHGPHAAPLRRRIRALAGRAAIIGFTGPPGVGKSTLVDAYIAELCRCGHTVGVAAVDPSSPLSGGAILGDRIRMHRHTADPRVFIRSIAARGHLGGLSENIHWTIDVMDAAGRDTIIVETVGAGQSEVEIAEIADVCIVVNAPGLGDDVQAIKAGLLEIADVLVVNKADLPLAERTARQLRAMLALREESRRDVPVVLTVATDGRGIADLHAAVTRARPAEPGQRSRHRIRRVRRLIAQTAAGMLRRQVLACADSDMDALVEAAAGGDITLEAAALDALAMIARPANRGHEPGARRVRRQVFEDS